MTDGAAHLDALLRDLAAAGLDPTGWILAWARLLPSLLVIPAFGLRGFPVLLRFAFASLLAMVLAPMLPAPASAVPSLGAIASELARGVPVAASAAIGLWGAAMGGATIDALRGGGPVRSAVLDENPAGPFEVLLSLGAAVAFFQLGGPARLILALASATPFVEQDLRSIALTLARGIQFAVVLAGPVLAIAPFLELLQGLVARVARPLPTRPLLEPLAGLILLAAVALLLDRFAAAAALWLDRALPAG